MLPRFDEPVVADYLEATHAIGDHLLERFAALCDELDVAYFLTSGTLLGAVRDGSWIPWDDDVDVIMFRDDYDRLHAEAEGRLPDDVVFSSAETRADHITVIPRLLHTDSHRVHVGRHRSNVPIETRHIPLDIFVLDMAPRNDALRAAWSTLVRGLDKAAVARYTSLGDVVAEQVTSAPRKAAELVGVVLARVLTRRGWHALRTWLVTRPAAWGGDGPWVATNYSTPAGRRMTFERDWYLPAGRVAFSGGVYPAPGDPVAVLTELYGPHFLEPPAEADRAPVHIRGGLRTTLGDRAWDIQPSVVQVVPGSDPEGPTVTVPPPRRAALSEPADPLDAPVHPGSSFRDQVLWSLAARGLSAALQVMILVLLARNLPPSMFAFVSATTVVLQVVVAVNGFGLLRQIEFRRSRDPDDPALASLFAMRLRFSYLSAAVWVAGSLGLWVVTEHWYFLALLPAAVWLLAEQTTQVWNGVSVVDGRTHDLVTSYLTRRLPVVVLLLVGPLAGVGIVSSWSLGLAAGGCLSYVVGRPGQEAWARVLWPRRSMLAGKLDLELGYWWGVVGMQLRDLDVAAVSLVSSVAAGFYAFPARLVSPMNLVTVSTATVAFPRIARQGTLTRRQLNLGTTLGILPVCLVAAGVALLAPYLPRLLGEAYAASVPVLRIACLTAVLSGAATLLGYLLQALSAEDARVVGYLTLGFAAAQVAVAALGAVVDGAVGAAWGVALVNGLLAVTVFVRAHQRAAR